MRLLAIALLLLTTACQRSTPVSAPAQNETKDVAARGMEKSVPEDAEEPHWVYTEVSDPEADAILVVVLNIPGLVDAEEYRFPLKRHLDPTYSEGTNANINWSADGVSKDGHGIGCSGSINLLEGDATHVTVQVSVSGTDENRNHITVEEKIQVPWLGKIEKKLDQGGSIAAGFESPKNGDHNPEDQPPNDGGGK
jgi:hypothetical protein